MRYGALGKLWLALALLVSSLGTAPIGSMEQGPPETIGRIAHMHLHPAARPTGDYGVLESQVEPYHPRSSWPPPVVTPFLHHRASSPLSLAPVRPTGPPASSCSYDYTPLCERLPYHATAPPPAA